MSSQGFDCAPGLRLHAHEQVTKIRLENLEEEVERVEALIDRLEKRFWLTLYGVVAVVLTEVMRSALDLIQ